jgi:F-type H+-transporting ATPase subunit a
MSSLRQFTLLSSGFFISALQLAASESLEPIVEAAPHVAKAGVSPYAYTLFEVAGFPVTNAMAMSWVISLVLVLVIRIWAGKPKMVPGKGQMVVETLVNGIYGLIEPIVGSRLVKPVFPVLIGLFTFILIQNWSGLIPGVGCFGFYNEHGHLDYWMRPGNADLNMTIALGLIHFCAWTYFVLRYAGVKVLMFDIFGNKADKREVPSFIYYPLFLVFIFVGFIEIISILFRNVSLPFRLFGNVFGGENLITEMTSLVGFMVPVPFYFLEILIGFVQALVFTLLVAVYIGLICNHEGGEEHGHH